MTMVVRGGECDVRCVVVGDDAVGKTSMLMGYATNRYPTQHVPSVFDNYAGMLPAGWAGGWAGGEGVRVGVGASYLSFLSLFL